ncbi:MAG: acyl-CoA dehydrogenase family protein [Desulfobacteraceae bacterium]|uniref:Acyl-CoA dehydrogenase family protein n=1 Tax=Candidatus Desulfacyla euxinica TaxID=2841693 RepID=A0A8J6N3R3_9DELT|nr:acyl-CoA dehydrogenase family protein [Candidatus Desulfacyla euxinica]MBL6978393.1 acyl-CoA dehydrogenase family protein [Desulfobacteraceae bacterium]MBL7216757.1 acyl-CoA dehydrogenase family protein [Desulfobacteraceae bacterium]
MDSILSEKHRVVRRSVRRFSERELRPIAKEIDHEARFPWEVVEKMGRLGYFGIQVPKELGGADLDSLSYAIIIEEISRVCASLGLCVTVHNSVAVYPILAFGSEEQKAEWVPPLARGEKIGAFCLTEPNAGSDATGIESTAIKDGNSYVVNANKVFVTNGGVADTCLIFVQTNPGADRKEMSVVVAERGTTGFVVGDLEDLCGMRANPVSSIRLYDCRVPLKNLLGQEGQGLRIGLTALDTGRIGIAAQSAGIGQGALEEALGYARQRRQFGVPIEKHQAIQSMIAEMATLVDASKLMTYRAAALRDKGKPFSQESAMAKLFASEASSKITDMAVQIHGGYGYSKLYPVERYYRDARVTRIYEGTSEIHRMVIARGLMK